MGEPFESSEAWKAARVLTNEVYPLCRREPLARDFGLRDQLQRASVSVMNNIAEGWESLHVAGKRQAYNIARRSCGEVRSMSHVLLDNKFVSAPDQINPGLSSLQTIIAEQVGRAALARRERWKVRIWPGFARRRARRDAPYLDYLSTG